MRYLFIALLLVCCGVANGQENGGRSWLPNFDSMYSGTIYKPFELHSLDGKKLTNESFRGKVVLLNFWFAGCRGCMEETGMLNIIYDSLKDNPQYVFLAVTFDSPEGLPAFLKEHNMRYPVATIDGHEAFHELNYRMASPSLAIIDKEGRIGYIGIRSVTLNSDGGRDISVHELLRMMRAML